MHSLHTTKPQLILAQERQKQTSRRSKTIVVPVMSNDTVELSSLATAFSRQQSGPGALWAEITALSRQEGVIDIGQGYPDFGSNAIAKQSAKRAISMDEKTISGDVPDARANQYAPIPGTADMLDAVKRYYRDTARNVSSVDESRDSSLVTTSATEGLYVVFRTLLNKDDEVMTLSPFFPWYLAHATVTECTLLGVPLNPEDGFAVTEEMLERAYAKSNKRVKIFVHCSPHNPTGHCASEEELEIIARFCRNHKIVAIADEVYERSTFLESKPHLRLREYLPERTVTVGTSSKLMNLSGWRVGWIYGPKVIVDACNTFHSYASFSTPTPLQAGVADALNDICDRAKPGEGVTPDENAQILASNAQILASALTASGLKVYPPEGGFFLVASVKNIKSVDGDAIQYCKNLARRGAKVSAVPMTPFYDPSSPENPTDLVRFAICKKRETIAEAARRIRENPL
ncbi:aspartate aminotransferase [Bathycoccus prasinos]|jgi:aspartate/methionine/tyrosine aminotransferase|uniref:Aspartate aminotransferase n=1 Tax=Bathycoccus prasinos TaxID=41875 RepID=K8EEL1_9CHLO|nr:aspartate aminotransferase [Bathycoccus prasinos]CCO16446.1 aspartate aminotransferase [Bathycoccus prasinos]|eukprot:XP_007512888.1 aspartate aminotransferase [Bathycoccus prasinos]